ncbi:unnamed protein product [Effrenium voratum]|nr:unnamed protein product [Effrenium voratum]
MWALTAVCYVGCVSAISGLEDLACAINRPEWQEFHATYEVAAKATAQEELDVRFAARTALAEQLLARTANISDVLSCNVGVVAGFYLLARLVDQEAVDTLGLTGRAPKGEAGLAYRLLQLALVFIFTLRNANRIPPIPGRAWGVTEHHIIPAIIHMRRGHDQKLRRDSRSLVPIAPSFRADLNIAVVSICAYPEDHPLALPKLTPSNREAYANRHGYALRLHLEHPVIGAHGLGVQHAKLATVLAYLQSNEFDWVAWLDCDSILMNLNRTLDSIIYQYAQRKALEPTDSDPALVCGQLPQSLDALTGDWLDSWVSDDFRDASTIQLFAGETEETVYAEAAQIGLVHGRLQDDELELDFQGGRLRANIVWDGSGHAERLEWENGAVWLRKAGAAAAPSKCREPCRRPGPGCDSELLDSDVNLLITEEGWGLSSANWIIKRSAWSMDFLHNALTAAHVELQLFGDQDAMILHLMNGQALEVAKKPMADVSLNDPIDRHAVVVPQFELNSYDALNALTMECDTFVEGDLLVTFPQCKDADGCNDVFELAADYAKDEEKQLSFDAGAWWMRRESTPTWTRYSRYSSAALRVFGPRPLVRDVFLREQEVHRKKMQGCLNACWIVCEGLHWNAACAVSRACCPVNSISANTIFVQFFTQDLSMRVTTTSRHCSDFVANIAQKTPSDIARTKLEGKV